MGTPIFFRDMGGPFKLSRAKFACLPPYSKEYGWPPYFIKKCGIVGLKGLMPAGVAAIFFIAVCFYGSAINMQSIEDQP
jgi:hypothetical protein